MTSSARTESAEIADGYTDKRSSVASPRHIPSPHRPIKLGGVLCCGRTNGYNRQEMTGIILPSLTALVHEVIDWYGGAECTERYVGDHRFLVLSQHTMSGTNAYVQIRSEPFEPLSIEVGPGNRHDALLQTFADGIQDPLLDRGFAIGGAADNFCKVLSPPTVENGTQIARELLAIVLDVMEYDGQSDLTYEFHQASILEGAHVVHGISTTILCTLLETWGFRASPLPEDCTVISVTSWESDFRIQLTGAHSQRKGNFGEIHCSSLWTVPAEDAASLVEKVNSRPYLIKAHVKTVNRQPTQAVRISVGINLAGGVTLDHIRAQIVGFLRATQRVLQFS